MIGGWFGRIVAGQSLPTNSCVSLKGSAWDKRERNFRGRSPTPRGLLESPWMFRIFHVFSKLKGTVLAPSKSCKVRPTGLPAGRDSPFQPYA